MCTQLASWLSSSRPTRYPSSATVQVHVGLKLTSEHRSKLVLVGQAKEVVELAKRGHVRSANVGGYGECVVR